MPYPAGHRATVKTKIIESARKLFNRYGFENVSLQQIMAGAELTHGGFYSYFDSKSDPKAQAIAALCIGGMVVARTMVDRELADALRSDCIAMALRLGGWDNGSTAGAGKRNGNRPPRKSA